MNNKMLSVSFFAWPNCIEATVFARVTVQHGAPLVVCTSMLRKLHSVIQNNHGHVTMASDEDIAHSCTLRLRTMC